MKKKLIRGLLGLVVFSNVIINVPILVYAEKMNNVVNASLDEAILDAVSDDFDDIDNPLAKELLFPVYCLGKNIDEIEKYVDFGNAKIKDRSDTVGKGGKQYTFSKDLSNYSDQTTGSEVWMFNDMGKLDAIVVNFFNRSDATNIEVLDNMKKVFGDDCIENKDSQKGIDSYDWHKPDMGIVQVYNYTGSDSAKDDGINSLTITFLGEKFTDAYKESLNDNSNNSTTADADTIKKVQQALNDVGYDCGTPDGVAGGKTTEAIKNYQTDKNMTVNGKITDELLDTLNISEKDQTVKETEKSKSNDESFVARGDISLMNFLTNASDNGCSLENPNNTGTYVYVDCKYNGKTYSVKYFVERQKVYSVDIMATTSEALSDSEWRGCAAALAKSLNPNIGTEEIEEGLNDAIKSPDNPFVVNSTLFRFSSERMELAISH